jgi:hypothetical protein
MILALTFTCVCVAALIGTLSVAFYCSCRRREIASSFDLALEAA